MRYAKKPTKIGKSERNEKHAYFPRKTHKNTENMRKTREKQRFLQNATLPPTGGVGYRFSRQECREASTASHPIFTLFLTTLAGRLFSRPRKQAFSARCG